MRPKQYVSPVLVQPDTLLDHRPGARFHDAGSDDVEDLEYYRPGGYCPIMLHSWLCNGRYEVLHKLGSGGSSTQWLARDHEDGILVAIKVLAAELQENANTELLTAQRLRSIVVDSSSLQHIRVPLSNFLETSANGLHTCLVQPLTGPSLRQMLCRPGLIQGTTRVRADLVPKLASEAGSAIRLLHENGMALHDMTSSNWAFSLLESVLKWTDAELYQMVGRPEVRPVRTVDGSAVAPHAPSEVVEPANMLGPAMAPFLQESIICIDIGDTVPVPQGTIQRQPTVPLHYQSPEAMLQEQIGLTSDIWSFALLMFEMLSGYPLIDPMWASDNEVLRQIEALLDKPPNSLRSLLVNDSPMPCSLEQGREPATTTKTRIILETKLRSIANRDNDGVVLEEPILAALGSQLSEREVQCWAGLLSPMLSCSPADRPRIGLVCASLDKALGAGEGSTEEAGRESG
ncbi:kinase-like protein [Dacryopinax primogenitus]|uniref:non-specific serine/threonine protein kinase n=1 Tax=Dacryopinax primogenitus (strain DJM 731) TaxID=1858805 RepID=M5G0Q7_DACPD|nr:kinase-like protein [Dacryopinax primogenitus]EJU01690.1 kinase-like protein [Dacryopinax primogenitus]